MDDAPLPLPGWYPDPGGSGDLRWWDGAAWSDVTHAVPAAPGVDAPFPPDDDRDQLLERPARTWTSWPVLLAGGLVLVIVLAVVALVSALAGRARLDTAAVERQIAQTLSQQTGQTTTVTCPEQVMIASGTTFTCRATTADGQSATIQVTQQDDSGRVQWRISG